MSNIPNLGEYGFIPPVTELKADELDTPPAKEESEKQLSDSTISSKKPLEEIIENKVEAEEIEVDKLLHDESEKETKSSKKYLVYLLNGFLLVLVGFFIYYIFNKFKNSKSNSTPTIPPSNVNICPPIPVDIECINRNIYNPFLKNRVGYFPNSSNFG